LSRTPGQGSEVVAVTLNPAAGALAPQTGAARKRQLQEIGFARFNTRVVRNIFFITNVLRLMRKKLNKELSQSRSVVPSGHSAVAATVTEYDADSFGPNEVLSDRRYADTQVFA
jgi:hypothetical protein